MPLDAAADQLVGVPEGVRRAHDVRQLEQRVVDGKRLGVDDVDTGAREAARAQSVDEGRLVDDRPARDVDEHRGGLEQPEAPLVEQPTRLLRQRACHDDDVGRLEEGVERDVRDAVLVDGSPLGDDDAHPPRREEARDLAADPAVADQPQRPSREAGPDRLEAPVGPVALVQRPVALAQPVGEREDERHRGRRHRVRHPSGVIVTATPRSVQASTSTKSRPTPCRARIASRSTPSRLPASTGAEKW